MFATFFLENFKFTKKSENYLIDPKKYRNIQRFALIRAVLLIVKT